MGSERPNFGSEQPNSLPDFKLKFYKRQIYSFAFLGSEFFCPQPKCKCDEEKERAEDRCDIALPSTIFMLNSQHSWAEQLV
jgi:hypothetical protein